jgi:putative endonuclease
MTNYQAGHEAEKVAAKYLERLGYDIVDMNWRRRVCEIDIIAKHNDVMYFVEVKSRLNLAQGSGLDYITPKKLKQMQFAAECWINEYNYQGDYELAAIEIDGNLKITEFLKSIT